jgi:hypothetical protein
MKAGTAARDRSPETGAAPHSALGLARNGGSAQSAAGTWAGAVSRDGSQSSSSTTEPSAARRAVGPDAGEAHSQEAPPQSADRRPGRLGTAGCRLLVSRECHLDQVGQRQAGLRRVATQRVSGRDGHSSSCAPIPATAANAHPAGRAGTPEKGAGVVTEKMKVSIAAGPRREVAVDDPSEQDRGCDQGRGTGGEPGISGAPRPEHDARRAGACQDEVGDQTAAYRPLNSTRPVITWSEKPARRHDDRPARCAPQRGYPGSHPASRRHLAASGRIPS